MAETPHEMSGLPSLSQEGLWGLCKLEDTGTAYNRGTALRLQGTLQVDRLEQALTDLLARHETLRSRYPGEEGVPTARIAAPGKVTLPVEDVSASERPLDAAVARAAEVVDQPYDLETGPLFRARLYRLGVDDHLLLLANHEIIADGLAWNTVLVDLAALYTAQVTASPAALEPPRQGFFALAQRQRQSLAEDRETLEEGFVYWKEQLQGAPVLEFPATQPRPAVLGHRGDAVVFDIDADLKSRLDAIGREQAATPFMVCLALYQLFLARYARQRDLVVGIAEAGRADPDTQGVVGFFLNALAVRVQVEEGASFRDLLEQVFEKLLGGLEYAAIPFEQVVAQLDIRRDPSRTPVFQTMFTYKDSPEALRFADLVVSEVQLPRHGAMFDLALYLTERGGSLRAELEYNTDLFDRPFMEACAAQFRDLMVRVAADPDAPVLALPWLDEAQVHELIQSRAGVSDADLPAGSFLAWVADQVQANPGRTAVSDDDGHAWTYAELWDYAGRVAAGLQAQGVARGALVGVNLERGAPMLGVVLGILRHGAAYLPLDPDFPPERLAYMVQDSGAVAVVTDDPGADFGTLPVLDPEGLADSAEPTPETPLPGGDDLAYVIYTSGSTGRPKGVAISHGNLRNFLGSLREELGITADDTLLAVTTLSFDIAGLELFLPLCAGAQVVIPAADVTGDGMALAERLADSGATLMQATPATWRMLLDAGWDGRLKQILCGGEALPERLAEALLSHSDALINLYGPTETTIWSTLERVTTEGPIRVGRPIANTRVYVLDEHGNPVPDGVPGEIWIAGAGVARGYLNRPELTDERFRPDPFVPGERMYRTGDLGRWWSDGRLEHLGRVDFQLKVHGYRIEAGEIETALEGLEEVRQAVVMARGEDEDRRLVAYLVFEPGRELLAGEMRRRLRESLPDYMVPGLLVPLEAMPLTPNGKVDRKALPDPLEAAVRKPEYEPPEGNAEQAIAGVWQELLGVEQVGRHDNFFELGGHSLLAMRVLAALAKRLPGMGLQPRDMYYMSVAQLAAMAGQD